MTNRLQLAKTRLLSGVACALVLASGAAQAESAGEKWLSGEVKYDTPAVTYDGPTITWRFSHYLAGNTLITDLTEQAIERLREESNGKLDIQMFYGGSLHDSQKGAFEGVAAGISDISTCYSWITPGGFHLDLGLQLPFLFDRATVAAQAIMEVYPEFQKKEYESKDVKLAHATITTPQQLLTRGFEINGVEDLSGKRMSASGNLPSKIVTALGGVPVPLTAGEFYSGFQQGVIDVMVLHDAGLKNFRIGELAKTHTVANLWANPVEYCMNPASFEKLPDDLKQVMELWFQKLNAVEAELYFKGQADEGLKILNENGVKMIEMSPAETEKFQAAVSPVIEEWIAEQEGQGYPARAFVDALKAKVAELDKLSDDEIFERAATSVIPGFYD